MQNSRLRNWACKSFKVSNAHRLIDSNVNDWTIDRLIDERLSYCHALIMGGIFHTDLKYHRRNESRIAEAEWHGTRGIALNECSYVNWVTLAQVLVTCRSQFSQAHALLRKAFKHVPPCNHSKIQLRIQKLKTQESKHKLKQQMSKNSKHSKTVPWF